MLFYVAVGHFKKQLLGNKGYKMMLFYIDGHLTAANLPTCRVKLILSIKFELLHSVDADKPPVNPSQYSEFTCASYIICLLITGTIPAVQHSE